MHLLLRHAVLKFGAVVIEEFGQARGGRPEDGRKFFSHVVVNHRKMQTEDLIDTAHHIL